MDKILLKQIWNERKSNVFLWCELLLVFVVLWFIVDTIYVTTVTYFSPLGFNIENTYLLQTNLLTEKSASYKQGQTIDDDIASLHELIDRIKHRPDVESVAFSSNSMPYNNGSNGFVFWSDSVNINCLRRWVTPDYFKVFQYQNIDGSGSESLVEALTPQTLVMSVDVADPFENAPIRGEALRGQTVKVYTGDESDTQMRVAALTQPVRYDDFSPAGTWKGTYVGYYLKDDALRQMGSVGYLEISIRVKEGQTDGFTDRFMADADRLYQVGNMYVLSLQPFSHIRRAHQMDDVNEVRTQLCVMFFLLINIFLGIIGTFWFRTLHRRPEIALRMALGSSKQVTRGRLISEGILLLSLAAIPALVITFNLGIYEIVEVARMPFGFVRFVIATAITFILMVIMIMLGIWYPARQAMKVQPAEALHEE